MSTSLGLSGSKSESTQDTTQTKSLSGSVTPTFGADAQGILSVLTNRATGTAPSNAQQASNALLAMGQQGGQNPFVEDYIAASNNEAGNVFDRGMAGLRAQGYRGGTAANIFGQGTFAGDFANKLAMTNAATRMGAYDTGQDQVLRALGAAAETGAIDSASALQLLALLRGESSTSTENAQIKSKGTGSQVGFGATVSSVKGG